MAANPIQSPLGERHIENNFMPAFIIPDSSVTETSSIRKLQGSKPRRYLAIGGAILGLAASPAAATEPPDLGIAAGGSLEYADSLNRYRQLDLIQQSGALWLRADVKWSTVQLGGPRSYRWDSYDAVIAAARQRGLRVLGTIAYTPKWASGYSDNKYLPKDPRHFGNFCGRAARRYQAQPYQVRHWEVWNEPNISAFAKPRPDLAKYVRMLNSCYTAIKKESPGATVLTGGTAPAPDGPDRISPVSWVKGLYESKAKFDAIAHHPYTWPEGPEGQSDWNPWHQMVRRENSIRSVMADGGDRNKLIWITEYGAPTNEVSEARQAELLRSVVTEWRSYPWAGPLLWYSHQDRGTDPANREQWFGLVRSDNTLKPAFYDFQRLAAEAR